VRLWHLIVAVLGLGVIAVVLVFLTSARDKLEGRLCRAQYALARSAADTSRVDAQLPPRERGSGENTGPNPTCGELRKLGRT